MIVNLLISIMVIFSFYSFLAHCILLVIEFENLVPSVCIAQKRTKKI